MSDTQKMQKPQGVALSKAEKIDRLCAQHSKNFRPEIGMVMEDGTIYAGVSPDTNKAMYVAPKHTILSMPFNEAAQYAKTLQVGDKNDFRMPSETELRVLFDNKDKGALKGTFNETGLNEPDGWYWSSARTGELGGWGLKFDSGDTFCCDTRLRCLVRSVR